RHTRLSRDWSSDVCSSDLIKRLVDFQFNENCHLHDYLYFDPEVTLDERGRISIQLPAIKTSSNFYLPKRCSHIVVEFDIKGFNRSEERRVGKQSTLEVQRN